MTYLSSVTHDVTSNTLEVVFCENTGSEIKRVSCRNYSIEQKEEFIVDLGVDADKYIVMAGW